jgi:hypothetical protein
MLTDETRDRLVTALKKKKDEGMVNLHVTSTRNMKAILDSKLPDGPIDGFIPWFQDEPVVLELLDCWERMDRGELISVDRIDEDLEQLDVRDWIRLMDEGKSADEAADIAKHLLKERQKVKDTRSFDVV